MKTIWVATLALLWAPITSHCQLEALPALEFLACCDHGQSAPPHQDDDCKQDGCATVESGEYRTQDERIIVAAPVLILPGVESASDELNTLIDRVSRGILAAVPPEHSRVWQFALRMALPVRAPSLAS